MFGQLLCDQLYVIGRCVVGWHAVDCMQAVVCSRLMYSQLVCSRSCLSIKNGLSDEAIPPGVTNRFLPNGCRAAHGGNSGGRLGRIGRRSGAEKRMIRHFGARLPPHTAAVWPTVGVVAAVLGRIGRTSSAEK